MSSKPYVYERQCEYWISRGIDQFYSGMGFDLITFPLTQFNEKLIPADFIFFDRNSSKIFGLQYKTLYKNEKDFWNIDREQHKTLSNYPWIYYCLSELKTSRFHREALHFIRISSTNFEYRNRLYSYGDGKLEYYMIWGAFYNGLESCKMGTKITSLSHLQSVLKPFDNTELVYELSNLFVDVFISDFSTNHIVHLTSHSDKNLIGRE